MLAENPDTQDIPMPIATAILDQLFAIQARLPHAAEMAALYHTIDVQARALVALQNEVARLRLALQREQQETRTALALHLGDPARERVIGRA